MTTLPAVPWTRAGKTRRLRTGSFHPRRFLLWTIPPDKRNMVQSRQTRMDAKHNSRLIKFMHFSNRLCFYGIGLIGGFFLVAYHTSATLFPDFDFLPISGTLFALISILFFSI